MTKKSVWIWLLAILVLLALSNAPARAGWMEMDDAIQDNEPAEQQANPPWYDNAWNYRRRVNITNGAGYQDYYQVLVKLDSGNFNFERAKVDGTDVRFTDSSGRNLLHSWIESWDKANQLAYLWVLVSPLLPDPYTTTIYMYYNNPAAAPYTGGTPFDFFDDFSEFTGGGCSQESGGEVRQLFSSPWSLPGGGLSLDTQGQMSSAWCVISGAPAVLNGVLQLPDGTGVKTSALQPNYAVGFRANFGLGSGREWGGFINGSGGPRTMIGDLTTDPDELYLINYNTSFAPPVLLDGPSDWHNANHIYEVRWFNDASTDWSAGDIDHGAASAGTTLQVPQSPLPVTLYSFTGANATLRVDWLYVRQYRTPEPTINMGADQGLVDLEISMIDSPDPLPVNQTLTYQLSISNDSSIDAPGVVVTDTLPANVQVSNITPPGICTVNINVVCNLGIILAHSSASISIKVLPGVDGVITNTVSVASQGFDLDLSNNTHQVVTLVDSVPPDVNWERPVTNGQAYTAYGETITLEASATDAADRVAWVQFLLFDHHGNVWVDLGTDDTYPYGMEFEIGILEPDEWYQFFVRAADRAGNISDPLNPLMRILIMRVLIFRMNLPVILR